jgi:hypothetical protein
VVAAREGLTGAAGKAALRPRPATEPLLVAGGLAGVILLAAALRVLPLLLAPSLNWGDEIFQTVEPAHRLVYGYGLVAWEFQVGMRSWLLPGIVAGIMELTRAIGDGPQYYLPAIAGAFALLACAPVVCAFLWSRRGFGLAAGFVAAVAVAVAPELVYFGARTLNEVVAAHVLVIACYLLAPGYPVAAWRRLFAAGLLFGSACLLRLQLGPAAAVIVLWPGAGWRARLPALIAGGLAALGLGAGLDWLTLGYPLASVWRNLYDNLYLGISSGFSVEPWFYYLAGELGVWLAATSLLVIPVWLGARRVPALAAAAVAIVVVHSAIAHKEYRFMYPAILLVMVLAAIGLAQLTAAAQAWLGGRGMRRGAAAMLCAVAVAGAWSAVAAAAWSSGVLAPLRQRAHDELTAMAFARDLPGLCGVGLYGKEAWVRYGGYTWLHRPVPMYWPADVRALATEAAGFNTLLYDEMAPPPPRGYAAVRCFGKVCVARRPGRCEARQTPSMWFPPQLRATAPPPGEFEAVPRNVAAQTQR